MAFDSFLCVELSLGLLLSFEQLKWGVQLSSFQEHVHVSLYYLVNGAPEKIPSCSWEKAKAKCGKPFFFDCMKKQYEAKINVPGLALSIMMYCGDSDELTDPVILFCPWISQNKGPPFVCFISTYSSGHTSSATWIYKMRWTLSPKTQNNNTWTWT